jgi:hypothetical protein
MVTQLFRTVRPPRPQALLLFGAFCLAGCDQGVFGNGQPAEETRELEPFDGIVAESSLDVDVRPGDSFRVELRIDSNLVDLVTTHVAGGRLIIDTERPIEAAVRGPHARVTLPSLRSVVLSGAGEVRVAEFEPVTALDFRLSGAGQIAGNAAASRVRVVLDGSGAVDLDGSADRVDLELSGSGSIDAYELSGVRGAVELSGSGRIAASLSERVDVDLSGSGRIDLFGGAEIGDYDTSGSGVVRRH